MEDKNLDKRLNEKYSDIAEKHPRIDFSLIDKIIPFVKNHPLNKSGIYLSEIAKEFSITQSKARTYCIDYIVPTKRIEIHKKGQSVSFPTIINSKDEKVKKNLKEVLNKSSKQAIEFFEKNKSLLNKELKEALKKLKETLSEGNPEINPQEKLVRKMWENGNNSILCVTFNRKAYRVC